jgi:hypothetical protein
MSGITRSVEWLNVANDDSLPLLFALQLRASRPLGSLLPFCSNSKIFTGQERLQRVCSHDRGDLNADRTSLRIARNSDIGRRLCQ